MIVVFCNTQFSWVISCLIDSKFDMSLLILWLQSTKSLRTSPFTVISSCDKHLQPNNGPVTYLDPHLHLFHNHLCILSLCGSTGTPFQDRTTLNHLRKDAGRKDHSRHGNAWRSKSSSTWHFGRSSWCQLSKYSSTTRQQVSIRLWCWSSILQWSHCYTRKIKTSSIILTSYFLLSQVL